MMKRVVGTWDPDGELSVPHAEVVAVPAQSQDAVPDGAIQMRWVDETGLPREAHLVRWWRLDRQGLKADVEVEVDVQARQQRALSFPPHHVSARLMVTGDPDDKATVTIGDLNRPGSWAYGVMFHGAVLLSTSLLLDEG